MTASEFAFLALGLVLGIVTGAALVVVLRSRPPSREVRLTVSHDAVPKRSATLSSDAFVTVPQEPARGGPADRRSVDREDHDLPAEDEPAARPVMAPTPVGVPVMRTYVLVPTAMPAPAAMTSSVAVAVATAEPAKEPVADTEGDPAFVRMLHGDHRAMLAIVDEMAGADGDARRTWQIDLTALVEATIARTIDLGSLHFPMGNPFWDSFTIDQCREIAGALAARGHRFDGLGGWADEEVPGYRELTQAVADAGLDPRRIRTWPNSSEIESLFHGARIAPEEMLSQRAPDLDASELHEILGARVDGLSSVWAAWERIRPLLLLGAPAAAH